MIDGIVDVTYLPLSQELEDIDSSLRQELAALKRSYDACARPILEQLARLQARRQPVLVMRPRNKDAP